MTQALDALEVANTRRLARVERRKIILGLPRPLRPTGLALLLYADRVDECLQSLQVGTFLTWSGLMPSVRHRLLEDADVGWDGRALGALTIRQRVVIADGLTKWAIARRAQ